MPSDEVCVLAAHVGEDVEVDDQRRGLRVFLRPGQAALCCSARACT